GETGVRTGAPRPPGVVARPPGGPGGCRRAGVGRPGRRPGAGESGAVPGEAARAVAGRGSAADASARGSTTAHVADPQGPVRGGLGGGSLVAPGKPRGHRQIAVRAAGPCVPGPIHERTVADVATPNPGVAACNGPRVGLRMPGWSRGR